MSFPSDDVVPAQLYLARAWVDKLLEYTSNRYNSACQSLAVNPTDGLRAEVKTKHAAVAAAKKVQEILIDLAGSAPADGTGDVELEFFRIMREEGWLPRKKETA